MIELIGENDSSEINDGKLLIKLRDEVVVEAGDGEVENDAMLVDEVGEVIIVVEVELDEEDGVVEMSGVIAWDEELVEGDVVVEEIEAVEGVVVVEKIEVVEGDVVVEVNVVVEESKVVEG